MRDSSDMESPRLEESEGEGEGEGLLVLLHTEEEALCRC